MYSLPNLRLLHIIILISPLSLVAQDSYANDEPYCDLTYIDNDQASCDNILLTCRGGFLASTDCMGDWCDSNCADPDNCCHSENRMSCFQSASNSSAFPNCTYIADHINSCISATTGFATLSLTDQVSCFCFDENKTYDGYSWDNAATSCYAAMATQTASSTSELDDYLNYYVGACSPYEDTATLSDPATSSAGASASAGSAASVLSSGSITATKTTGIVSGATTGTVPPTTTGPTAVAGTPSPTTTASRNTGAKNGSEGSGMILGAFLIICCLIASLKQ